MPWAARQNDSPCRSEAVRRLVEIGPEGEIRLGPRQGSHEPWTPAEDAQLLALTDSKMDRASIARKLKRTVSAITKRRNILNNDGWSGSG
jgi:hypothetical protein